MYSLVIPKQDLLADLFGPPPESKWFCFYPRSPWSPIPRAPCIFSIFPRNTRTDTCILKMTLRENRCAFSLSQKLQLFQTNGEGSRWLPNGGGKPWRAAVTVWVPMEEEGSPVVPTKSPLSWVTARWAPIDAGKGWLGGQQACSQALKTSSLKSGINKPWQGSKCGRDPNLSHKDQAFVYYPEKGNAQGKRKPDYTVTADGGHRATAQDESYCCQFSVGPGTGDWNGSASIGPQPTPLLRQALPWASTSGLLWVSINTLAALEAVPPPHKIKNPIYKHLGNYHSKKVLRSVHLMFIKMCINFFSFQRLYLLYSHP